MLQAEIAFRIGRRIGKHPFAGRLFCATERFLPLNRITRTKDLVVFHHPRPVAHPHVLIVPTRPMPTLITSAIQDQERAESIWKTIDLAREVTHQLSFSTAWQLVINGGARQDIGQVHAHLMHSRDPESGRRTLIDPAIEPEPWRELFSLIRAADQIHNQGYSLEIQWIGEDQPTAKLTQSMHTY